MKYIIILPLLLAFYSNSQCTNLTFADSSFELGLTNSWDPGNWVVMDGGFVSEQSSNFGDSSFCTQAGGCYQSVQVDSNTIYHMGFFIYGGSNGLSLFYVNGNGTSIITPLDNWTFVSHEFNSGSDTVVDLGVYSNGTACFDDFSLTCESVLSLPNNPSSIPFSINTSSDEAFVLTSEQQLKVSVYDLSGKLIETWNQNNLNHNFGIDYPAAIYILNISVNGEMWQEKLIKQ